MAASIEVYGATEFEAPGLHWRTPYRDFGEVPTDPTKDRAIVEIAERWLDDHLPWLRAAADVYGFYLHCDGKAIFLTLPGEQAPSRLAIHFIGLIDASAQPLPTANEGPLQ